METFLGGRVALYGGDSREVLREFADNTFDSVVCDPPYSLVSIVKRFGKSKPENEKFAMNNPTNAYKRASAGFMGCTWDTGEVAFDPAFWAEVLRVLKPGGHLVAFSGTRTYHRMACAIEDSGFEVRDQLQWVYSTGFPKSHNQGDGWGTALKPANEPIALCRKPLSEKTVAANVLRWRTGALNIDGCRVEAAGQRPYNAAWENERILCSSCAERVAGTTKHSTPETKASIATRPVGPTSNGKGVSTFEDMSKAGIGCFVGMTKAPTVINSSIDVSGKMPTDQSQKDLRSTTSTVTSSTTDLKTCAACGARITPKNMQFTKTEQNGSQPGLQERGNIAPKGRWPSNLLHDGSEEVLELFPTLGKSTGGRRGDANVFGGMKGQERGFTLGDPGYGDSGSAARFFYSAKADSDSRAGSKHPTVKPVDLMQWLIRLVTPKGGHCLDPFAGSGSTAEAAFREGCTCTLIEREAPYRADIARRMALVMAGPDERSREIVKAKGLELDAGPLFEGIE